VDVDADDEIDGAVAAILVIVAFELARLGRDRLAHLADELDRALVEADHRPRGIGRFGIEVEHIFHAGDIFAVDRHWLDRTQSEMALWAELRSKLATTRSAREAFDAYATCAAQQMKLTAEDGQRLLKDFHNT
jgi:hypothetical protein